MDGADALEEVPVGDMVIAFDGRVLEVLNGANGSMRVHVSRMKAKVRPTRKGRLYVEISASRRATAREIFEVMPEERPGFEELWSRVEGAAAPHGGTGD